MHSVFLFTAVEWSRCEHPVWSRRRINNSKDDSGAKHIAQNQLGRFFDFKFPLCMHMQNKDGIRNRTELNRHNSGINGIVAPTYTLPHGRRLTSTVTYLYSSTKWTMSRVLVHCEAHGHGLRYPVRGTNTCIPQEYVSIVHTRTKKEELKENGMLE